MKYRIECELVRGARPKRFRKGGRQHRNVRIYLAADGSAEMDDVRWVRYELHPTFREPLRTSDSRSDDFEIRIWSYGYFKVQATVMLADGNTERASGFVKW